MASNIVRVNFNTYEEGEQYRNLLNDETNSNFLVFLSLLSSYFTSSIDGPLYTRYLKTMANEIARIRLSLDDVQIDDAYKSTRTEFLYQVVTSMVFPDGNAVDLEKSDVEFRSFLVNLIALYFKGSIPSSLQKAVELVINGNDIEVVVNGKVQLIQDYLQARKPGSGYDISDEFTFEINILLNSPSATNIFLADKNIRILLDIMRPAHTLQQIKYILQDTYTGQQGNPNESQTKKVLDALSWEMTNYNYEDFRKFTEGVYRIDTLGTKKAIAVVGEDHTGQFP